MYSSRELVSKYLKYYLSAKNGKGHGIHSPFVFDFVIHVLNDHRKYDCYEKIEILRKELRHDNKIINIEDFGAGSAMISKKEKKIKSIAKTSLKNKKFAKLLFRIVNYYKPGAIIELGTSFGISTCYLASGNKNAVVYTFEGSSEIANIAKANFETAGINNIQLIEGDFAGTFSKKLSTINQVDLAFVDGNHRKQPTLHYFFDLKEKILPGSVIIFDDIHWSAEMEEAWKQIQEDDSVTLSIDLFFVGMVFFNPAFKVKQHFIIRF